MCAALERYDEALTLLQRAKELDPMAHRSDLSTLLLRAGRYPEALAAAKAAVDFDPLYDRGVATLGWAYLKNDMPAEGIAALERAAALSPGNSGWLGQLGEAYALAAGPETRGASSIG
jgi:predicted Zn-dependent protease